MLHACVRKFDVMDTVQKFLGTKQGSCWRAVLFMLQCQNVQVTENSFFFSFFSFGQTIEVVVRCGFSLEGYDWLLVYTVLIIMPPAVGVMILLPACDLNLTFKFWVVQVFSAMSSCSLSSEFQCSVVKFVVGAYRGYWCGLFLHATCYIFWGNFIYNFDLVCNYLYLLEIL